MTVCKCGEQMIGDGYTSVFRCPNADDDGTYEPDANPVECDFKEPLTIEGISLLLNKADSQFRQWKRPSNQVITQLIETLSQVKDEMVFNKSIITELERQLK